MTRIEDMPNKSELIKQYYEWLLDSDNISLERELDLSLAKTYDDPYIYYPDCMHDLFHTKSLQRLARVSQLSLMFQTYPGAYHSRLEHSIGAFGKKQEEHLYLYQQSPDFVKYVEENGLKKFLVAEEVKMLYHDVGHFPFSHVTEQQIIGKREVHEKVGQDILLTDPEVSACISKLGISDELRAVLTQNILNSDEHDEGNIDVDRKDYLQRDSLHIGGPNFSRYPIYLRKLAQTNPDGSYKKAHDGHIILADSLTTHSRFIDVYPNSAFSQVEEFLTNRQIQYQNKYFHSTTLTRDTLFGIVLSEIAHQNGQYCPDLIDYIDFLKSGDYKSAEKYDDVRIYKSLINLGLNSENNNVIDMVSLLFVPFDNWLETMYEPLDKSKDSDFIRTIHRDLIKGNSRFATNIKSKNFFDANVILVEGKNSRELQSQGFSSLIYSSHSFSAYNPSSPVFVEDKNGNVFALEEHPERSRNWLDTRTQSHIAICILPLLKLKGLSPFEIDNYVALCRKMQADTSIDSSLMPSVNMKHRQTHNSIHSYFSYDDDGRQ